MNIRVQYHGQLRMAAGRSDDEVQLPEPATLADLLTALASRLEKSATPHLVNAAGEPQSGLLIVANEIVIPRHDMAKTALKTGDVVALLPPIAGG